jgi:hypothetical protein
VAAAAAFVVAAPTLLPAPRVSKALAEAAANSSFTSSSSCPQLVHLGEGVFFGTSALSAAWVEATAAKGSLSALGIRRVVVVAGAGVSKKKKKRKQKETLAALASLSAAVAAVSPSVLAGSKKNSGSSRIGVEIVSLSSFSSSSSSSLASAARAANGERGTELLTRRRSLGSKPSTLSSSAAAASSATVPGVSVNTAVLFVDSGAASAASAAAAVAVAALISRRRQRSNLSPSSSPSSSPSTSSSSSVLASKALAEARAAWPPLPIDDESLAMLSSWCFSSSGSATS